jgi:5-methyltetrahydrofolate--homocysteine methyltransferase
MSTKDIASAVLTGQLYEIGDIIKAHLSAGEEPRACLDAMMAGLDETGKRFEAGDYFVPELMMAGDTFKAGMEVLTPRLISTDRKYAGVVVLGTVKGDVHDIGKNLVGFLLQSSGFRLIDVCVDVSPEGFVQAVKEHSANVLAMSALLTTTMLGMRDVLEAIKKAGLRDKVKVIIGGAPVSQRFAKDIGADAYGATAPQGLEIVRGWFTRPAS